VVRPLTATWRCQGAVAILVFNDAARSGLFASIARRLMRISGRFPRHQDVDDEDPLDTASVSCAKNWASMLSSGDCLVGS